MGKAVKKEKKEKCYIKDCDEEAMRSISTKKLGSAFNDDQLDLDNRRTKLCKTHYREYKKKTKKDRKIETLGRDF